MLVFFFSTENLRIDNNAILDPSPSGVESYVTAVGGGVPPRRIEPILAPLQDNTIIDDTSLLTDMVSIGCKASGRPKARITWYRTVGGGPRMRVNLTLPEFSVQSRRQGQSLLTVNLASGSTDCFMYICVAENGVSEVEGLAMVCPRRKCAV